MDKELDSWFTREILAHEAALVRYLMRTWRNRDEVHDLRQEGQWHRVNRIGRNEFWFDPVDPLKDGFTSACSSRSAQRELRLAIACVRETLARQETYGRVVTLMSDGKWCVDGHGCDVVWIEDGDGETVRFDRHEDAACQVDKS